MNEELQKELDFRLNCFDVFQQNFPRYIDIFVDYYGEEKRAEITEKFMNVLPLGYINADGLSGILDRIRIRKSRELIDKVMSVNEMSLTAEEIFERRKYGKSYENKDFFSINSYLEFKKLYELGPKGRVEKEMLSAYNFVKKEIAELTFEEFTAMVNSGEILEKYNDLSFLASWTLKCNINSLDSEHAEEEYKRKFNSALELITSVSGIDKLEDFTYDNENIQKLNALAEKYEETLREYEEFKKANQAYFAGAEKRKNERREIKKEGFRKLLENSNFLLSAEEQMQVQKYLSGENSRLGSNLEKILGRSLDDDACVEAFSEKNESFLTGGAWRERSIKKDRISYFKAKGIDLGDNYDDYLNSAEAKAVWPSQKQADRFVELKEQLQIQTREAYDEVYKKIRNSANSREYVIKDFLHHDLDGSNIGGYEQANLIQENGEYKVAPIVNINFVNIPYGAFDEIIIHELNHVYETSFNGISGNYANFFLGWDITNQAIDREKEQSNPDFIASHFSSKGREYELFNEIINETIAQEIYAKMRENNKCILDTPEKSMVATDIYEEARFLIQDFYSEFKDDIIRSRSNGNIDVIFDAVGKENFDELNGLFKVFEQNLYSQEKYEQLERSLDTKEDNEMTRLYYSLIEKRDEILEKMRAHKYSLEDESKGMSR